MEDFSSVPGREEKNMDANRALDLRALNHVGMRGTAA